MRLLRKATGWTQAEAADRFTALGGAVVTGAAWSAMERSVESDRVRAFTADVVAQLAVLFAVTPGDLFVEPSLVPCTHCGGTGEVAPDVWPTAVHPSQPELPLGGEA